MAESAVFVLVRKLDEFPSSKWDLVVKLDVKIQSLRNDLEFLQPFLKDVDERGRDNEMVKVWISNVRGIAFRAENAVDEYLYKVGFHSQCGFIGSLRNFANHVSRLRIRRHLGVEIEDINNSLQSIKDKRNDLGIDFNQSRRDHHVSSDELNHHKILPNPLDDIEVVGFEKDVEVLREKLVAEKPRRTAICIVGMAGIGKTTLARKLYNSDMVKSHFETRSWVSEGTDLEDMMENLKNFLKDKRYLLVIDDIRDASAWDDICNALPEGAHGSRIMVTTRGAGVARHIDPHGGFIHNLHPLTEYRSWDLFCLKVFGSREGCPENLEDMGKRIVLKLGGLPLAISVMGGLLSSKSKTEDEWSKLLNQITDVLNKVKVGQAIDRTLMLSFDASSQDLRSCFLYFGLFPEGSEIDAERLIQMWVAEGFVKDRGGQTMEDVGEDYLEELANRSVIQAEQRDLLGKISKFHVHDLFLDVSIYLGKMEEFSGVLHVGGGQLQNDRPSPRRLAFHGGSYGEDIVVAPVQSSSLGLVRSVLSFGLGGRRDMDNLVGNLRLLRVLNLKGLEIDKLPEQIIRLFQLQFLGLEDAYVDALPSSIGMLSNLQTLRLGGCDLLPETLWKIETLRHINVTYNINGWANVRRVTSCKANLQTLQKICAGDWVGRHLHELTHLRVLHITEIGENHVAMLMDGGLERLLHLKRLKLDFCLEEEGCIENVRHVLAKLEQHLPRLQDLDIDGYYYFSSQEEISSGCFGGMKTKVEKRNLPQLLQNEGEAATPSPLRFPASLVKLRLWFPRGLFSDEEEEMLASLSCCSQNLKILVLGGDVYCGKELTFSHNYIFPKLEELELFGLAELEEFKLVGAFHCLKRLTILDCENLKAVPEGLQHIATLQQLTLRGSMFGGQPEQGGGGTDWDKIKHVPSVIINDRKIPSV